MVTRRKPCKKEYRRIYIGDAELTDDPNDDWLCISFNSVYIGDFCPNCIYINKNNGRTKILETSLFSRLLSGFFIHRSLMYYKFDKHHRLLLERFVTECFKNYSTNIPLNNVSLEHLMITFTQQRV